ncbi:jg26680 [Pararge aegeria aegeria]|uniref:Jg26680 protein n=1 Tax=Pararge aegeria aegeria TaxID=348720 RepID=A0A8S4RW61_9NEOP|nr:jg26680 [Pararge aegeria aegeria]
MEQNMDSPTSASPQPEPEDCDSETDYSSIRGKMILVSPNADEYDLLRKHLLERLDTGNGEVIYDIGHGEDGRGLTEDEYSASVATLQSLVSGERISCVELRRWDCGTGLTGQYLLRTELDHNDFMEIRVAVVGNVDAGKSTLLGVLTHGELDNGRGYARQRLFRHKHEAESGRTSSVGNDILGFDSMGNVVNKPEHGALDWVKICEKSSKVITFIDLAGHERYLKTTVFGMTGHAPDFGMLMIGANAGIVGMTKEHLGLALALAVPVFVVVTKIDMCPPNVLQDNLKLLIRILKSSGCRKVPVMVKTKDDVIVSATNFVSQSRKTSESLLAASNYPPARPVRQSARTGQGSTDHRSTPHTQQQQQPQTTESDVTAVDSPFEVQADKRAAARRRKRHDKPPPAPAPALAAN